jgi:hypothetical protein
MVKYNHCEKCKKVYNTETWIGEVHSYSGVCPSCIEKEQKENQMQQESVEDHIMNKYTTEYNETTKNDLLSTQSLPIEIEKKLLSNLEQRAIDVLSGESSINVLIKEIKDGLIDKAKKRIEETIQSFDSSRIEAQEVVNYAENTLDYLSEYKDYLDRVIKKLQDKPKLKVKNAIEKVFKETMKNLSKDVAKDVLLNQKAILKRVYGKAVKWYNIYSNTNDVNGFTKKLFLHPFNEIQKRFSTLPFYS